MRFISSIILIFLACLSSADEKEKLQYVNPFIGTTPTLKPSNWEGHGRTYPGAVAPFGFIQLTPETRTSSGKGYDYSDPEVFFFSCMEHMSGYPHGSSGECAIQAIENTDAFQFKKSSRPFSHHNETAEPGYYKLMFDDNGTITETTATTRCGMFRFSYKNAVLPKIFIGDIGEIEVENNQLVKGSNRNVVIEFNTSWSKVEKLNDGVIISFDTPANKTVLLKLSSSLVSHENAKENIKVEIPDWDFDRLKSKTQKAWEEQLSVIDVKDSSVQNKTKFYTALYHSLLIPWIVSDVNKEYKGGDNKIYKAKGKDHYGAFSPWDTFRSLHPLLCIVAPERQNDMIVSMLEIFEQTGQLPVEPMTGYHSIPIIVDSYFKNITGFDKNLAYKAMQECIVDKPFFYEDMESYIENGYIPASFPESVTRTVEYAYNDWALSQFAKLAMNKPEDYLSLFNRGFNFQNLFDAEQMFLVPREKENFVISHGNFGFKEGDKWNYSFFVPHNPKHIINLMGGDREFTTLLDSAITNEHILFDNEPNFHIPYLFNYSKKPSKTQGWIADIRETYFSSIESGLPGNDDLGSLSSWFVFNALGFYPVCPGVAEYNIGTPLFKEVTIHSKENKSFTIKGSGVSENKKYIQTASFNGENLDQSWISHSSLVSGGELILKMGSKPSTWASKSNSAAYSASKKDVQIIVDSISVSSEIVEPHELVWVKFSLKNIGGAGLKIVRLLENGELKGTKNVFVDEGKTMIDSLSFRLYNPGLAKLMVNDFAEQINIQVKKSGTAKVEYSELSAKSLIHDSEEQQISFTIKNISGIVAHPEVKITLNKAVFSSEIINLKPGESKVLKYNLSGFKDGINKVAVDTLSTIFKVYNQNSLASLVDLNFQNYNGGKVPDGSGFLNDGIVIDPRTTKNNKVKFGLNTFVEIKKNSTFSALDNKISLMAWVKASDENKHLSSIITQGDHNVIQIINKRQIEFFIGGWGRGICLVDLPDSFLNEWNHIAGVCDGSFLKVYINGELKGTAELNNYTPINAHGNWNLGRNSEFPNKRIFYGELDGVKIFASPLSKKEINSVINKEKTEY